MVHQTMIVRRLCAGVITALAVHQTQSWMTVGTTTGNHNVWDMRFMLSIAAPSICHKASEYLCPWLHPGNVMTVTSTTAGRCGLGGLVFCPKQMPKSQQVLVSAFSGDSFITAPNAWHKASKCTCLWLDEGDVGMVTFITSPSILHKAIKDKVRGD